MCRCLFPWFSWGVLLAGLVAAVHSPGANVVVIGDSLSAEYEAIPDVPGLENPTEYARVTVPGWEAMSWVEVLAEMRPDHFHFGRFREDLLGWQDLRFSGYEFNFAIPGFRAAQYENIVNSSLFSNPQYLLFRATLQDVLRNEADGVVVWLGANEIRANYGFLTQGGDPVSLIRNLRSDLEAVLEFVQRQKPGLRIVLVNLPDLGAAPSRQRDHPDPAMRAVATAAIRQANAAIAELAASKGVALADIHAQTERLLDGAPSFFGAVDIFPGSHPDNHPRFHFTRDGLHPNTAAHIEVARVMIEAFNTAYQTEIPSIRDAEALHFLNIRPDQPYYDWLADFGLSESDTEDDPDGDGLANLVELAFGLDPTAADAQPIAPQVSAGRLSVTFTPDARFRRLVRVVVQQSSDLAYWTGLPGSELVENPDQSWTASIPLSGSTGFLRVLVELIHPE